MPNSKVKIDEGFKRLLWPLDQSELDQLEASIKEDGCRDSVTVWKEEGILVDGHNRYEICTRLGIEFPIAYHSFGSRDDAEDWVDRNQAARRNVTPERFRIILGRIQERRKKTHGGDRKSKRQLDALIEPKTSASVAEEFGVSERTVERAAQRAVVYDAMLDIGDQEAAQLAATLPQAVVAKAASAIKKSAVTKGTRKSSAKKAIPTETNPTKDIAAAAEHLRQHKNRNAGPRTDAEERKIAQAKARKTFEAGMRAIDDLHVESPDKKLQALAILKTKEILRIIAEWKV